MEPVANDEWRVIESLLPSGWEEAARETGAFQRVRYLPSPGPLLRLLLFHAVNDAGLRETVAQARAAGVADMSDVALLKRLRTSGDWLQWIASGLSERLRQEPRLPEGMRVRAVDSTTVQGPASKGVDWRLHYSLDLRTLSCDWFELTDAHGGELLERTPMQRGDVMLGDRNYLRPAAVRAAVDAEADVLLRMRWNHHSMTNPQGKSFKALSHARKLRVGQVGEWEVRLKTPEGEPIPGRVIAVRLPAPLAQKAERRALKSSAHERRTPDPRSLEAAHLVLLFTTLSADKLAAKDVLELYRFRWQIELAFKRLKGLLRIGRLPHKDRAVARTWILAKLVTALLLEVLFRNANAFSPWGFCFQTLAEA